MKYCAACHGTKDAKGDLDLERFASAADVRKELKPWAAVADVLDGGEMPPKKQPQPTAAERKRLSAWVRGVLAAEARLHAGDPGRVVVAATAVAADRVIVKIGDGSTDAMPAACRSAAPTG